MFNKLKDIFGLNKKPKVDTDLKEENSNLPESIQYNLMDPILIKGNEEASKSILLMDDFVEQFTLYELDFNRVKRQYEFDILKEFKVYEAIGVYAGFTTHKLLEEIDDLSIAILDMTLEMSIKLSNGKIIEYDGVDIAIEILEKFPECQIVFCTAHSLNKRDPLMSQYITKFEDNTKLKFDDFYMSKADTRYKVIYDKIVKVIKKDGK